MNKPATFTRTSSERPEPGNMASAYSNAGSFNDNMEEDTSAARDCLLHPSANGKACGKCMDDLKLELATTKDLLTRAMANEERTNRDLLIASQKLTRFKKDARRDRADLDERLTKIISEAGNIRNEVNARLDGFTNEVTQRMADIKLYLSERLVKQVPATLTPQQNERLDYIIASTSKAAEQPVEPKMCKHHELLGRNSDKCSDEHCSMRGQGLAAPKRPHPEQSRSDRLTKRTNVGLQPPPTPLHSVTERDGDESWSTETQTDGETGNEEDDDVVIESVVHLGKGHASTK